MLDGRMIFIGIGFNSNHQVSETLGRVRRRVWVLLDCIKLYLNLKSKEDMLGSQERPNIGKAESVLEMGSSQGKKEVWMRND